MQGHRPSSLPSPGATPVADARAPGAGDEERDRLPEADAGIDLSVASEQHPDLTLNRGFQVLERAGLALAAQGRLVTLLILGVFLLFSTSGPQLYNSMLYVGAFTLLSVALLSLIRTRVHRPWMSYVFVLLEVLILAEALLTPNPFNAAPWPDAMVYRYDNFYYFFILIGVSVFSYSPALVLWSGLATALVWGAGLVWKLAEPDTVSFAEALQMAVAPDSTAGIDMLGIYLDPNVVLVSGRIKEMVVAVLVAGSLAVVVWRGRRTVMRLLASNRDRAMLRDLFGRYVPRDVARIIEHDRGVLQPENRIASVLFADIEAFTQKMADISPDEALRMLNAYFGQAAEVMARFGGVVTQFQGDAMLVTFNVPVADPQHASQAVRAALALLDMVDQERFAGQTLNIRVGVSTGPVIAGSVGGGNRLHYTVHGDAVNLAARLEQLNKTQETRLLISAATRDALPEGFFCRAIPGIMARGLAQPITVYKVCAGAP